METEMQQPKQLQHHLKPHCQIKYFKFQTYFCFSVFEEIHQLPQAFEIDCLHFILVLLNFFNSILLNRLTF